MNFDECIDRRCTESLKWKLYPADVLPLWVADTDFLSPEAVRSELKKRIDHGIFGYGLPPEGLDQVVIDRVKRLYDWDLSQADISYVPGIVTGFNIMIRSLCKKGEAVIFQSPAYPPFISSPEMAGLKAIHNPMYLGEDGIYQVDFELFEQQIIENDVKVFILCNPQNPTGRVFTSKELEKFGEICLRQGVTICSDEIHCDILFDNHKHIPIASLDPEISKITATFIAPSKTYNIAGLHASVGIIQDETLRKTYCEFRQYLVSNPCVLSLVAAKAAYEHGDEWLKEQNAYLQANRDYLGQALEGKLSGIKWSKPQATFLAWLDCRELGIEGNLQEFFIEHAKVCLNDGPTFGKTGEGFVRLNFGTTQARLEQAIDQMAEAIQKI